MTGSSVPAHGHRVMNGTSSKARSLNRWAARILIVLSVVHIVLFTALALSGGFVSSWWAGDLRSTDISKALLGTAPPYAAFWASIGSIAIPILLLGVLIGSLTRANIAVPGFVGYGLAVWLFIAATILEPSGFPLAFIAAAMLIRAHRLA